MYKSKQSNFDLSYFMAGWHSPVIRSLAQRSKHSSRGYNTLFSCIAMSQQILSRHTSGQAIVAQNDIAIQLPSQTKQALKSPLKPVYIL